MRQLHVALAVIAAAIFIAACGGSSVSRPTPTSSPQPQPLAIARGASITIGVSAALTGDQTSIGRDINDAVNIAVRDNGGTVKGRAIKVTVADDGCTDAEMARHVAQGYAADNAVVGVIGPMCTTGAQAANGVYERAGVIHISPSATRVDLSAQNEQYFFRVSWRDDIQASLQAGYAWNSLAAKTVVLVDDGEPYGRALADEFSATYEQIGGRIVSRERVERGTTDMAALARKVKSAAVDAIVFEGLNPEGALILKALKTEQFTGVFIGPDGLLNTRDFLAAGGPATEGAIISGGPAPDDAFVAKFREATQRVPATPFVLQAYDATTALIKAIDAAASEDAAGVLIIDRAQLAAKLRGQQFSGLTGSIHFDEHGDRAGDTVGEAGIVIYRVTDGRFVPAR